MSKDWFILSAGQSHKIELAMNRSENGEWTPELVHLMTKGDALGQFRRVLLGHATITTVEHVIDLDAAPFNPWEGDGWAVEEHQKGDQWKFDPKQVELYLHESQKAGRVIEGNKLRTELAKKAVFNANLLDYLLKFPHLIPEEWKKDERGRTRYIFFWGTVYRDRGGDLYVRYLYWDDGGWRWCRGWLDGGWRVRSPAAVRAS